MSASQWMATADADDGARGGPARRPADDGLDIFSGIDTSGAKQDLAEARRQLAEITAERDALRIRVRELDQEVRRRSGARDAPPPSRPPPSCAPATRRTPP